MKYVCSQCGIEIPEEQEFCYRCGSLKSKAFTYDDNGQVGTQVCHNCGQRLDGTEDFCPSCGTPPIRAVPVRIGSKALAAILLAMIPGFFNIFGLGHILLKQYVRGGMFLIMSGILWWIYPGYAAAPSITIMFIKLGIFMYQLMDLYRVIYARGGNRWTGPRNTGRRRWTACLAIQPRSIP